MGYADLHIHVKNDSDNKAGEPVEEILKEAVENDVYTISLTSHNSLKQYQELFDAIKKLKNTDNSLYNTIMEKMKFAIGVEINSRIEENMTRDMLVYNIPIEKIPEIQKWLESNTNKDMTAACQLAQLKHFKNVSEELGIPYKKGAIMDKNQIYAGMVFATAVKDEIDDMLADILAKENPISKVFEKLIQENNINIDDKKDKKQAYKEIINDENILKNVPKINQIKQLYYQIIDLRLFANQNLNVDTNKTVMQEINSLKALFLEELKQKNVEKLDKDSINMINAELYAKFFEKDSKFFDVNENLSSLQYVNETFTEKKEKEDKDLKLTLYYSIAEQINEYLKNNSGKKNELKRIQEALINSKISFADILERLNWFNSELVRHNETAFSFDSSVLRPKVEDVIKKMHEVGGIVMVAHPYVIDLENVDEYLEKCANKGVDGIEAFYALSADEDEYEEMKQHVQNFCSKKGLISAHGGTDYHRKGYEKVGMLRNNSRMRISEEMLSEDIEFISAKEFMAKFEKTIDSREDEEIG